MIINQLQRVGAILKNKLSQYFISTGIGFDYRSPGETFITFYLSLTTYYLLIITYYLLLITYHIIYHPYNGGKVLRQGWSILKDTNSDAS